MHIYLSNLHFCKLDKVEKMAKLSEEEREKAKQIVLKSKTVVEAIKAGEKSGIADKDIKRYWRRREKIRKRIEKMEAMSKIKEMAKRRKKEDKVKKNAKTKK